MLLPTMTLAEIQREIIKDMDFLFAAMEKGTKQYLRSIKNVRTFPYRVQKQYVNNKSHITYYLVYIAPTKYRLKDPFMNIYTKYSHEHGVTYIRFLHQDNISIYTPHFIKRYRERMHIDEQCSNDEIFMRFIENNPHSNELKDVIIEDSEKYYHDENTVYYGSSSLEGISICEMNKSLPDVRVFNTFISPDLFFKQQQKKYNITYFAQIWHAFSMNYPPQEAKLNSLYLSWIEEDISDDDLLKRIKDFIANY